MYPRDQMQRNYRHQSNSRDVGNTSSERQPPVQPEYHNAPGTSQSHEAVNTTRLAPRRGLPTAQNVSIPPMFPYAGPTQHPNSAAQNAQVPNISGTNNYEYGNQAWEGNQTGNMDFQGSQPRNIGDTQFGNSFFAQNEHVNSSNLPSQYEYNRSLSDIPSRNPSGAPNRDRPWSDGRSPSHHIGDTSYEVQFGARDEYANENTQSSQLPGTSSDAGAHLNEGVQAFRPGRPRNAPLRNPSAGYIRRSSRNTENVLPSAGASHVPSRAQSDVHNRLFERNLTNLPPQVQPVVNNQHFDFSSQISQPRQGYHLELQAGQWPEASPFEQEQYAQQHMAQAMNEENDGEISWELSEDEDTQSPPKKKERKSTRGPLVDAPHAALQVPDCDLTASDIFCLFPKYYLRRALMKRFVNNGWQAKDIADAMNWSRGIKVKHQMIYNGSMKVVRKQMKRDEEKEVPDANMRIASTDLPARFQDELPHDTTTLYELAARVRRWPGGRFMTPVMRTVKWCWDNEKFDYTLADLPRLIRHFGFQMPAQVNGMNLDQEYRDWIKFHFGANHQACAECTPR